MEEVYQDWFSRNYEFTSDGQLIKKKPMNEQTKVWWENPNNGERFISIPDDMMEVISCWKNGYKVQSRPRTGVLKCWCHESKPTWNFEAFEYRKSPTPRKFWIVKHPAGIGLSVSDDYNEARSFVRESTSELIHVSEMVQ